MLKETCKPLLFLGFSLCALGAMASLKVQTSGDPTYPTGGRFYGYANSATGPGADAFAKILALAEETHAPLIIIYGKDNCPTCNRFVDEMDTWSRASGPMLNYGSSLNAYFRGNPSGTGPAACVDAYNFLTNLGATASCHIAACYGVCEDGTVYSSVTSLSTSYTGFGNWKVGQCDAFYKFAAEHLYTPPAASCGFAVEDGDLKATGTASSVYVPFIRTNSFDVAETNWIVQEFPDGLVETNELSWTAIGEAFQEIEIDIGGRLTNVNDTVLLVLLNTNLEVVATNSITCVDSPDNSPLFPYLHGEVASLGFGEWSLDAGFIDSYKTNATVEGGCFMVLSGSVAANEEMVAAIDFFGSAEYLAWAQENKVRNILLDCPANAATWTGASLLSYDTSVGAFYRSVKGIADAKASECASILYEDFFSYRRNWDMPSSPEALLVRSDGTVAAIFTPYVKNGEYSVAENIYRLNEMFEYALDDLSESGNDYPKTTPLALSFGDTTETNTLHLSDRLDYFALSGFPEEEPVQIVLNSNDRAGVKPTLALYRWVDANKTALREVEKFAGLGDVWCLAKGASAHGLVLKVTAWEDDVVAATRMNDHSWFKYSLSAGKAPEMTGEIGFVKGESGLVDIDPDYPGLMQTVSVLGEETVAISVERTGYTGAATATVSLVETNMPAGCYSWICDANGATNLSWSANEYGAKTIYVDLKDVYWGEGTSNLLFQVAADGASIGEYVTYSVDVVQGVNEDWLTGTLSLTAPDPDADIYAYAGTVVSVSVDRVAGWREGVSTRGEARGEAMANLSVSGGTLSSGEISWAQYRVGEKSVEWTLPEDIGNSRSKTYSVTLTGRDCDGKDIVVGAKRATVCVVPLWSKEFDTGNEVGSSSGVQYTEYHLELPLKNWVEGGDIEIIGLKTSGVLPAGLTAKLDKTAGKVIVSGVPTASTSAAVTFQIQLRNKDGSQAMSFPTTAYVEVESLSERNPGFASSRTWTGLPVVDSSAGRLAGLLDLTVAKTGRTSARYRKAGGTVVAFSAKGLTSVSTDEKDSGMAKVEAERTVKGVEYALVVNLSPDGALVAAVDDPDFDGHSLEASVAPGAEPWSAANTAEKWAGLYSVAFLHEIAPDSWHPCTLCTGIPVVQIRFASASQWRTGKATFAGTLPNGKSISGTATFVPSGRGEAALKLPLLATSASDTLSALLSVDGIVENHASVTSIWQHVEAKVPTASYENGYVAMGSLFASEDWSSSWTKAYGTNTLAFVIDDEDTGGRVSAIGTSVRVSEKGGVSLGFQLNRTSGLAAGTFRAEHPDTGKPSVFQWRAAALPGFAPFAVGSYWYNTSVTNESGKVRSARGGGSVSVGSVY